MLQFHTMLGCLFSTALEYLPKFSTFEIPQSLLFVGFSICPFDQDPSTQASHQRRISLAVLPLSTNSLCIGRAVEELSAVIQ